MRLCKSETVNLTALCCFASSVSLDYSTSCFSMNASCQNKTSLLNFRLLTLNLTTNVRECVTEYKYNAVTE